MGGAYIAVVSNDATAKDRFRKMDQRQINRAIAAEFLDLVQHLAFEQNLHLNQLVLRRTETGWQAIIKASRGKKNLVDFVDCPSFQEVIELTGNFAAEGLFSFIHDKYPPKYVRAELPY